MVQTGNVIVAGMRQNCMLPGLDFANKRLAEKIASGSRSRRGRPREQRPESSGDDDDDEDDDDGDDDDYNVMMMILLTTRGHQLLAEYSI